MKLPEPVELNPAANSVMGYTEAQLKQGQRDALEAAASIVENFDTPDCGGWTALGMSDAIRKLMEGI